VERVTRVEKITKAIKEQKGGKADELHLAT
jgi:hypothetical protein